MLEFTDKKQKARVLKLILKAKEILSDQDKLVKNWNHLLENDEGNPTGWPVSKLQAKHCRGCIIGGIHLAYPESKVYLSDDRFLAIELLSQAASKNEDYDFTKKHTIKQVQKLYDKAIKKVEHCEAFNNG